MIHEDCEYKILKHKESFERSNFEKCIHTSSCLQENGCWQEKEVDWYNQTNLTVIITFFIENAKL